jgi:mannose-6-phosphate isomerase-like protein (cupin superfamily)
LIKNNASQDKVILNPDELNYAKVLKPWGYEYLFYQDKEMAIWLLHIKAGAATSLHCHLEKETTMYVIQGSVIVSGLNREVKLTENESLQIDKKVFHKINTFNIKRTSFITPELAAKLNNLISDNSMKDINLTKAIFNAKTDAESFKNKGKQLIGMNVRMPTSLDEFYLPEKKRLYKTNQER